MNVSDGIPSFHGCGIHHMNDDFGPFNMAKKIQAKTHPFGRTFDQAGNIRDDKAVTVQIHHS